MKAFEEYREGRSFGDRVNRDVLSKMCEDRGLSTNGYKAELLSRLNTWVCRHCLGFSTFSLPKFSSEKITLSRHSQGKKAHLAAQC